jgi:hypothetical protein
MHTASACWPVMPAREACFALEDWPAWMMKWPAPGLKVRLWLGGDKIFELDIAELLDEREVYKLHSVARTALLQWCQFSLLRLI